MAVRVVHATQDIQTSWGHVAVAAILIGTAFPAAPSKVGAELVYADGRREMVQEARKDSKGRWTAVRDGRITMVTPGEVAVVVDADGTETEVIPPLLETPDAPETVALLASLRDPKNDGWLLQTAAELAKRPTRGIHDALVQLTTDKKKETRVRAVGALARLRTKESVTAATAAVLAEKDPGARREEASTLFSVEEIFKRCEAAQSVGAGIADKDAGVRHVFAMLSPRDHEVATAVLRNESLKNSDHHVRESAALELGLRGDRAGESILIGILSRDRLPGVTDDDELAVRLLTAEQVEICKALGRLGTESAKAALTKATSSKFEAVRKAAEAALAAK